MPNNAHPQKQNHQAIIEEDEQPNQPNNRTVELLTTVIQYVVNVKLETIIKVMLEHHNGSPLSSKIAQLISSEAKDQMSRLIAGLLQAAFTTDEQSWFDLLKIADTATDDHLEQFISVTELINSIFDSAQYELNRTNPIQVSEDLLDELAKQLFQSQELRSQLALVVSSLMHQHIKTEESPSKKQKKTPVVKKATR